MGGGVLLWHHGLRLQLWWLRWLQSCRFDWGSRFSELKDLALLQMVRRSQLRLRVKSLAQELPCAMGVAIKKKFNRKKGVSERMFAIYIVYLQGYIML